MEMENRLVLGYKLIVASPCREFVGGKRLVGWIIGETEQQGGWTRCFLQTTLYSKIKISNRI